MSGQRQEWQGILAVVLLALFASSAAAQERGTAGARADVVLQALSLLGTPYRYGGSSPETGLDCSGFVRHVFAAAVNRDLPRRSEEIGAFGEPVSRAELQPGDLVFFNTLRRAFSHVAIYIGEGRFVHAPARRGSVRIEGLNDRYWATRFNGARRVIDSGSTPSIPASGASMAYPALKNPTPGAGGAAFVVERPPEP
ncbi:MAG: C40 family peptidase [Burkholderiaceae bacterium]